MAAPTEQKRAPRPAAAESDREVIPAEARKKARRVDGVSGPVVMVEGEPAFRSISRDHEPKRRLRPALFDHRFLGEAGRVITKAG